MLKVSGSGFDGIIRSLERLSENARTLDGRHSVSAGELFNAGFMHRYTRLGSFEDFSRASPCELSTALDWIPPIEFEQFVQAQTTFQSWREMFNRAVRDWTEARLFTGVR
jgi:hypothetical protein